MTMTQDELAALQDKSANLEEQLKEAGAEGDVESLVELAKQLSAVRDAMVKAQRDVNKVKISSAETALISGFKAVIEAVEWQALTGEAISTVVFYRDASAETESSGPVYSVHVNPKRGRRTGTGTSTRKTRSNAIVHRMAEDGEIEHRTVKDVVQAYGSQDVKANSLYGKKAWGRLFPRVNQSLSPSFEDCDCKEKEATEEASEEA